MSWGAAPWGSTPWGANAGADGPAPIERSFAAAIGNRGAAERFVGALRSFAGRGACLALPRRALSITVSRSFAAQAGSGAAVYAMVMTAADAFAAASLVWRPVVTLAGVDVSARLTGDITVEAEEGAARVAGFALLPQAGPVALTAWAGRPVTIAFALMDGNGAALHSVRLFTGVVEAPEMDAATAVTSFACTDRLQEVVSAMTPEAITALVGGYWHHALYNDAVERWTYAQDRLQSVAGALDLSPFGAPRLTAWAAKTTADWEFATARIVDGSARFRLAGRTGIVNRARLTFQHQAPRLKRRVVSVGYRYPFDLSAIMLNGYTIPTRGMIEQAVSGTGWEVYGPIDFIPVPGVPEAVASYTNPDGSPGTAPLFSIPVELGGGNVGAWSVTTEVAEQLCFGFSAALQKRYTQHIERRYSLTVESAASIAGFGPVIGDEVASLKTDFDASEWERGLPAQASPFALRSGLPEPEPSAPVPEQLVPGLPYGEASIDYDDDPLATTAQAQAAMQAMMTRARVRILGAHRATTVSVVVPIEPRLDLTHTVRVATARVVAKGKARRVRHALSMTSGEATTAVDIAVSRVDAAAGQTDSSLTPPAPPQPAAPDVGSIGMAYGVFTHVGRTPSSGALTGDERGYFTNVGPFSASYSAIAPDYPVQFIVRAPEVADADRDNLVLEAAQTYQVAIPDDEFTVTA